MTKYSSSQDNGHLESPKGATPMAEELRKKVMALCYAYKMADSVRAQGHDFDDESFFDTFMGLFTQTQHTLLQQVRSQLPEKRVYKEATDITDHWGLTENSITRQIDNMKSLGHNEALAAVTKVLDELEKQIWLI
jgi:hypothetical protein